MLEVELLTDDPRIAEICHTYWQQTGRRAKQRTSKRPKPVFAFTRHELAKRFGLTETEVRKIVRENCYAYDPDWKCEHCGEPFMFGLRNEVDAREHGSDSDPCADCRNSNQQLGQFGRQWEHFDKARRALMAPHPDGEDEAFVTAFHACNRALYPTFDATLIDEMEGREHFHTIERLLGKEVGAESASSTLDASARALTLEERQAFSHAVDELANYFTIRVFCS